MADARSGMWAFLVLHLNVSAACTSQVCKLALILLQTPTQSVEVGRDNVKIKKSKLVAHHKSNACLVVSTAVIRPSAVLKGLCNSHD